MRSSYVAYGLQLRTDFPLPGMTTRTAPQLPGLELCTVSPAELERKWSGAPDPPLWQGLLGDGCTLTIERGEAEDLLFTYADRARFRLRASRETLDCAPSQQDLHWQQALLGKVLPTIAVIRGYEGLHAAGLDSPAGVLAIAAPSGTGKSTLAVELLQRGWRLFADDTLVLERQAGEVRAHPGTPHMNLAIDRPRSSDEHPLGRTLATLAGERWLAVGEASERSRPVRMVCMLDRGPGMALEAATLPSNPLLFAPYMLGLFSDAERRRDRFCLYGDLIDSAAIVRLTAGAEHRPQEIADLLERTFEQVVEPVAEALA
jgi:hypothetical protein